MATANEALFDAAVAHAIFVNRFGGGLSKRILALLNKADADLVEQIAVRLDKIKERGFDRGPATTARLAKLLGDIRATAAEVYGEAYGQARDELTDFAGIEAKATADQIARTVDVGLDILKPAPSLLRAAITKRPFQGKHLRAWVKDLEAAKIRRLIDAVNIGLIEGQTNEQIIRRIRGTKALNYRDGILEVDRRHAEAIVRTATNHVSNAARQSVYEANADIVKGVRWVSTLDSRTTPICRSRDGKVYPLDSGPRPPAHPRCRSSVVSILRSWTELSKDGALQRGRGADDIATLAARNADEAKIARTRASMNGQVPADLTYDSWLRRQSAAFQDDVLGPTRGRAFRKGVAVDQFVDRAGREYTLDQLRARHAEAFG